MTCNTNDSPLAERRAPGGSSIARGSIKSISLAVREWICKYSESPGCRLFRLAGDGDLLVHDLVRVNSIASLLKRIARSLSDKHDAVSARAWPSSMSQC